MKYIILLVFILSGCATIPPQTNQRLVVNSSEYIEVNGYMNEDSLYQFVADTLVWSKQFKMRIVIGIDSVGGNVVVFQKMRDIILILEESQVEVTCVIVGKAMSSALALFSYCPSRLAVSSSVIMWHSASASFSGRKLNEVALERELASVKQANLDMWQYTESFFEDDYWEMNFKFSRRMLVSEAEDEGPGFLKVIPELVVINN